MHRMRGGGLIDKKITHPLSLVRSQNVCILNAVKTFTVQHMYTAGVAAAVVATEKERESHMHNGRREKNSTHKL